ncbi:UDP-glycosyltransferase 88B1-like [Salvia divinorum]|uniref:Glycosyltransferase n=1 Tax=Salvia divinorum TaxID=28513 RepID=A0ABD1FLA2_SALDI
METIVLYPSPGMGHLISMVELGKSILRRQPSLSITVLTMPPPYGGGATADYISHISTTVPSIAFHHLPAVSVDLGAFHSTEAILFEVIDRHNPHVLHALETVSASAAVSAFITDFFCTAALPIAAEFGVPTYYFLTSGAHFTALLLHLRELDRTATQSFKDMKRTPVDIPGVPPVPASEMVISLLDRTLSDYRDFVKVSDNMPKSDGIIINTFESLEPAPLAAMREGKCNRGGRTPPIFCVGPLLAAQDRDGGEHECLKWLDKQPSKSVVYISFGSLGLVSAAQLKEMAEGLERSGHRFLWVVRSPPWEDKAKRFLPPPEPDLVALLPPGFLERTEERGMVVKRWAPQVAVLGHAAVGGFVSHCGWNSILEAVCAGVPMVAWPLYAEQHFNRVVVAEGGLGLAVGVEEGEGGLVAAEEVERRVREVMEGVSVRKVVEEKSVEAAAAMAEGGSSVTALGKLLDLWKS